MSNKSTTPTSRKDIHTTRVNPNVTFDSESKKDAGEIDRFKDTSIIQDIFIFCPMLGPIVLNKTLEQYIFASEREMSQMEDTNISIINRLITIEFEKKMHAEAKCKPLKNTCWM